MKADVCLFLEGTYPFVPGGVSSWVHQIVTGLPELSFSLLHLGPRPGQYQAPVFELPKNVVELREGYLVRPRPRRKPRAPRQLVKAFGVFSEAVRKGDANGIRELAKALDPLQRDPAVLYDLLHCRQTWKTLRAAYCADASEESFVDFYWHWVGINHPLLQVLATEIPDAMCYHTVSTGYAGLMAAMAKRRTGRPMIVTEHGIYTKERRIEIHAAEWIRDNDDGDVMPAEQTPFFRRQWNQQFEVFSRMCYAEADRIVTLFEGNRREQLREGADLERTRILPNGIDLKRFDACNKRHRARTSQAPFTIGFAGRVAPIKDLRTLLSAARLVAQKVNPLTVRIMGPLDEDPAYVQECREYVRQTGLEGIVRFEGRVDLSQNLDDVDVLVLTSISEAQPIVLLEAGAAGVPVVCTDVGACSEIVHGSSAPDRKLGSGGVITPIATPGATASAILQLWRDPQQRRQLGDNLYQRVRRYYDQATMLRAYRSLYEEVAQNGATRWQPAGAI